MSVANEFHAVSILVSVENKLVQMACKDGTVYKFPFTFTCRVPGLLVAFDMDKGLMAVVTQSLAALIEGKYVVIVMKFWLDNDLPVPATRWYNDQGKLIAKIKDEFKEKLASYMLDGIINS